jgi:hypothetical protein
VMWHEGMEMVVGAETAWSGIWRLVQPVAWWRMPSCVPVWRAGRGARSNWDVDVCSAQKGQQPEVKRDWRSTKSLAS